jgi:hypothetical protein
VRAATDYANSGHNVYIEGRTIKPETASGLRGDVADSALEFALVIDSERDFDLGEIVPSMTVESSPAIDIIVRKATRTERCYDKIDEGRDLLPVVDIKP